MRSEFCSAMLSQSDDPKTVFLTGDLGFMALEPLREKLGGRFINCGIAEQNMVTVAAGMAKLGIKPWVYSIAPFIYARPFEQIRNDVCFHNLPVKLIGNGGGYGYGVMGPTHHAIEDCGVLLTLPNMLVCVPAFNSDVEYAVSWTATNDSPTYLRLGRGDEPKSMLVPRFQAWRNLMLGGGPIIVVLGPLVGSYLDALASLEVGKRPSVWVVSILPLKSSPPPQDFIDQLILSSSLIVAEEHVDRGGLGWELLSYLQNLGISLRVFKHLFAQKHHYEHYGSQNYLRNQSALGCDALMKLLIDL